MRISPNGKFPLILPYFKDKTDTQKLVKVNLHTLTHLHYRCHSVFFCFKPTVHTHTHSQKNMIVIFSRSPSFFHPSSLSLVRETHHTSVLSSLADAAADP